MTTQATWLARTTASMPARVTTRLLALRSMRRQKPQPKAKAGVAGAIAVGVVGAATVAQKAAPTLAQQALGNRMLASWHRG